MQIHRDISSLGTSQGLLSKQISRSLPRISRQTSRQDAKMSSTLNCLPWHSCHHLFPLDLHSLVHKILGCQQSKATAGKGCNHLIYYSVSFLLNFLVPVSCDKPKKRVRTYFSSVNLKERF